MTDNQRHAYDQFQRSNRGADGFNNNPLSPPSSHENPLARDWNKLNPDGMGGPNE